VDGAIEKQSVTGILPKTDTFLDWTHTYLYIKKPRKHSFAGLLKVKQSIFI